MRDERIDAIKGLLILFVILGHVIGSLGIGALNDHVWMFIYFFHMPLFILISGYFSKRLDDKKSFWKSLLPFIVILFVFQFISLFIVCVVLHDPISISLLITPYWTLWYLLSLVFWKIMLQFTPKFLIDSPYLYLAVATVISVFCGLIPYGRILSIQRTLNFFPFFLYGYYMRQGRFAQKLWNNKISYLILTIAIVLIIISIPPPLKQTIFFSCDKLKFLLRGSSQYSISEVPLKACVLICSFLLSISLFNIIPKVKALSCIGKDSLLYYLYHGILIRFVITPLVLHFNSPSNILFMLLYSLLVVCIIYFIGKLGFFRRLVYPRFVKKYKG